MVKSSTSLWKRIFGYQVGDVVSFNADYKINLYGTNKDLWVRKGERALVIKIRKGGQVLLTPFREDLNHMNIISGEEQIFFVRSARIRGAARLRGAMTVG